MAIIIDEHDHVRIRLLKSISGHKFALKWKSAANSYEEFGSVFVNNSNYEFRLEKNLAQYQRRNQLWKNGNNEHRSNRVILTRGQKWQVNSPKYQNNFINEIECSSLCSGFCSISANFRNLSRGNALLYKIYTQWYVGIFLGSISSSKLISFNHRICIIGVSCRTFYNRLIYLAIYRLFSRKKIKMIESMEDIIFIEGKKPQTN